MEAFAAACCRVAQGIHPDDSATALRAAAASFTALRLTAKQLGALVQLPSQPNEVRHEAAPRLVHKLSMRLPCTAAVGHWTFHAAV